MFLSHLTRDAYVRAKKFIIEGRAVTADAYYEWYKDEEEPGRRETDGLEEISQSSQLGVDFDEMAAYDWPSTFTIGSTGTIHLGQPSAGCSMRMMRSMW